MSEEHPAEAQGRIVVFGAKKIRRAWVADQWFFSVIDIVAALTDSKNPRNYWNMMKAREQKSSGTQLSTFCVQLKPTASDGKSYSTDCVNTEAAFGIIQSIPSPKAEPFKRWLASVGYRPREMAARSPATPDASWRPSPAARSSPARTTWRRSPGVSNCRAVSGAIDRSTTPCG